MPHTRVHRPKQICAFAIATLSSPWISTSSLNRLASTSEERGKGNVGMATRASCSIRTWPREPQTIQIRQMSRIPRLHFNEIKPQTVFV